jgi:hypothetical protein
LNAARYRPRSPSISSRSTMGSGAAASAAGAEGRADSGAAGGADSRAAGGADSVPPGEADSPEIGDSEKSNGEDGSASAVSGRSASTGVPAEAVSAALRAAAAAGAGASGLGGGHAAGASVRAAGRWAAPDPPEDRAVPARPSAVSDGAAEGLGAPRASVAGAVGAERDWGGEACAAFAGANAGTSGLTVADDPVEPSGDATSAGAATGTTCAVTRAADDTGADEPAPGLSDELPPHPTKRMTARTPAAPSAAAASRQVGTLHGIARVLRTIRRVLRAIHRIRPASQRLAASRISAAASKYGRSGSLSSA